MTNKKKKRATKRKQTSTTTAAAGTAAAAAAPLANETAMTDVDTAPTRALETNATSSKRAKTKHAPVAAADEASAAPLAKVPAASTASSCLGTDTSAPMEAVDAMIEELTPLCIDRTNEWWTGDDPRQPASIVPSRFVEPYASANATAGKTFASLHEHVSFTIDRATPLEATQRNLVLEYAGAATDNFSALPVELQQPIMRIHTLRWPSSIKVILAKSSAAPSSKRCGNASAAVGANVAAASAAIVPDAVLQFGSSVHPLVIEFADATNASTSSHHLILGAPMTQAGAWMYLVCSSGRGKGCASLAAHLASFLQLLAHASLFLPDAQWNEWLTSADSFLPSPASPSSAVSPTGAGDLLIPSTSSETYSFDPQIAIDASFRYMQVSRLGLTLVGDNVSLTIAFVEWQPPTEDGAGYGTRSEPMPAWRSWRLTQKVDENSLEWKKSALVAEQPEKE